MIGDNLFDACINWSNDVIHGGIVEGIQNQVQFLLNCGAWLIFDAIDSADVWEDSEFLIEDGDVVDVDD